MKPAKKAIGVSNFETGHLAELRSYTKIKPAINQIENLFIFDFELNKTDLQTTVTPDLNKTQFPG